jgi:precorrin-6A/cobalt-precorrin-6A reductase
VTAARLLILGGTGEAASLAQQGVQRFAERLAVTTSLAGRTEHPAPLPGDVRIGGFGGPAGLAAYLRAHEIDLLVDATHPFAAAISAEARCAAELAGVPRLLLLRPMWRRHALDRWIEVEDLAAAAAKVALLGRRAWLTIGTRELDAFAAITDVRFLVRMIDPPRRPPPLKFHQIVLGRGPFTLVEERHLIQRYAIDVLVAKASGGAATEAKLVAAREMSLPVLMVRRPAPEPGETVPTVEAALAWIDARLGARAAAALERRVP